jgi:two-component system osmolarity sensor histidine kinase EnvZ
MRLPWPRQTRIAKRFLPRSLLARSLLIVLVPLVLVEAVALRIFYGTHFDVVSRRFSGAIAGEIAATIDMLGRYPAPDDRAATLARAWTDFDMHMRVGPGALRPSDNRPPLFAPIGVNLAAALEERVGLPFAVDWGSDPNSVVIRVQLGDNVLIADAPRKRLYTGTIYLFVLWLVGSALLLFAIAALFMRNQVRGIRRLADAAEAFGIGRDAGPIKPEGATEVRQAGAAFNLMRARVRRFLTQRTEMLAGVSHDLRTPLTRLRLAVAMLPAPDERTQRDIADMTEDLEEMDRMIGGYLAFVRGVGEEPSQPVDLPGLLEEVAARARRAGADVVLEMPEELPVMLRPDAFRRAVTNLVDNARRHARHVRITATALPHTVQVAIEDDGPGIAPARREEVFRAFESGPEGGTGLGLTIALDIVRGHGGNIVLEDSPLGGLRARITLPV